ncbi:hypothetical protein BDY21DRAFT_340267 [Lineolata rhizophorae]|uniref:Uncharacterized protein n=1 Tax=Lineolata rhizophorae TaxID=578093 RepID=A0A6A6P365_9PEZI|nr:hypothetical protein BDY21DRAFT_340267 [Lineolata rhizophorae]
MTCRTEPRPCPPFLLWRAGKQYIAHASLPHAAGLAQPFGVRRLNNVCVLITALLDLPEPPSNPVLADPARPLERELRPLAPFSQKLPDLNSFISNSLGERVVTRAAPLLRTFPSRAANKLGRPGLLRRASSRERRHPASHVRSRRTTVRISRAPIAPPSTGPPISQPCAGVAAGLHLELFC